MVCQKKSNFIAFSHTKSTFLPFPRSKVNASKTQRLADLLPLTLSLSSILSFTLLSPSERFPTFNCFKIHVLIAFSPKKSTYLLFPRSKVTASKTQRSANLLPLTFSLSPFNTFTLSSPLKRLLTYG